ncbi:glycoside hydrolase family 105 protein [Bacillus sp. FJAT-26390]|uniref:glycoside hydrolase family 88/105 protein n=1 Tax=Bacillus sp. FJAT-26390 TaxID=1743142 RepID=UPI000807D19D|nr:glycoside hydrolase family 88 protein [Bacillus sp. FJAT-26390]OBZ13605.1 glycosyl hydrolase [Bacillus sp. FJAT-26390]
MQTKLSAEIVKQAADRVYHYMLEDHSGSWGMDLNHWDWVPGVGVIAMLSYYELSGEAETMTELIKWSQNNLHLAEKVRVINAMAPYTVFPALYEHTHDAVYLETAERIGQWMLTEAPRTREGAFEHTVTENVEFPEQVWADTIFMAVLFLAKFGRLTGDAAYANEAVRQLELHLTLLQDEDTGVLFHGWNSGARDHLSAARWTRANAWIAVAMPMIVQELEGLADVPKETLKRYQLFMRSLIRFQQEDGLWATVLDRPDFYPETSGSAGIACGIVKAVRQGLLDAACLNAAYAAADAILLQIEPSGEVRGVSGGTPIMPTIEAYNEIGCYPTLYGQGLVLMLLSELSDISS